MLREMVLLLHYIMLAVIIVCNCQSERDDRRRRIQSLLQGHDSEEATHPSVPYQSVSYSFSGGASSSSRYTLPPVMNTWVSWNPSWYGGRLMQSAPTTTTIQPVETTQSPFDLWYYKDDSDFIQGPFSSSTMMEWHKAGYFR